ncbi:MAG TPA: hypothetical protein VFV38_27290 [Ktedonobacteraceae bacterium]|nr:hypothetical protein [Ktedonobacteraceae bacterium]
MKRHLLLLPDLPLTMGEGSVVALLQISFVLRFHLLPGPLGAIFTGSGLLGGLFSLTAPLTIEHQPCHRRGRPGCPGSERCRLHD